MMKNKKKKSEENICEICGREYKMQECEYCRKEKQWKEQFEKNRLNMFPSRIVRDLKKDLISDEVAKKFSDLWKKHESLFFFGDVGSGKTLLACRILLEMIKNNYVEGRTSCTYDFVSVPDLLRRLRKAIINQDEETESDIIEHLYDVDYLVLDDLGAEKASDWVLQELYLIVNHRYEWLKHTIFTSNYEISELANVLDDVRIPSRLNRMCYCMKIDYRSAEHEQ